MDKLPFELVTKILLHPKFVITDVCSLSCTNRSYNKLLYSSDFLRALYELDSKYTNSAFQKRIYSPLLMTMGIMLTFSYDYLHVPVLFDNCMITTICPDNSLRIIRNTVANFLNIDLACLKVEVLLVDNRKFVIEYPTMERNKLTYYFHYPRVIVKKFMTLDQDLINSNILIENNEECLGFTLTKVVLATLRAELIVSVHFDEDDFSIRSIRGYETEKVDNYDIKKLFD